MPFVFNFPLLFTVNVYINVLLLGFQSYEKYRPLNIVLPFFITTYDKGVMLRRPVQNSSIFISNAVVTRQIP